MVRRIVSMGGGWGGATAAQFARKTDRTAEITIIEREPYPQYSRCGLPYGISGIIPDFVNLIEAPEERLKKNRMGLHLGTEATKVDTEGQIRYAKPADKNFQLPSDSLVP